MLLNRSKLVVLLSNQLRGVSRTFSAKAQPEINKPKEKWDLFASVLLERHPVIIKELNPLEKKMQDMLSQIEFENSLKSDHEVRNEREKLQAELVKKGDIEVDTDSSKQTAQDFEDACVDELAKFKLAPRTTEADKTNDIKSLNRKLDETLVLLVQQKLGNKSTFLLPQTKWNEGETMRQAAERALQELVGSGLRVQFYGNAPCGFYKYKYPAAERSETVGGKIFFYRATLRKNVEQKIDSKVALQWRSKSELDEVLKKPYSSTVAELVI